MNYIEYLKSNTSKKLTKETENISNHIKKSYNILKKNIHKLKLNCILIQNTEDVKSNFDEKSITYNSIP